MLLWDNNLPCSCCSLSIKGKHKIIQKIPIPMESSEEKQRVAKCQFYSTFTFSVVAMCSFAALLFLVPFIVDPALATIMSDFSSTPVDCAVVRSGYVLGASNCSWSSCREGCTRDIFDCHQVIIEYSPLQKDKHMVNSQKKISDQVHLTSSELLFLWI